MQSRTQNLALDVPLGFGMDSNDNEYVWHLEHTPKRLQLPEHNLVFRLIEDAVEVLRNPTRKQAALVEETMAWFLSEDRTYIFSFNNCCDALGWDPDYFRRKIEWPTVLKRYGTGS